MATDKLDKLKDLEEREEADMKDETNEQSPLKPEPDKDKKHEKQKKTLTLWERINFIKENITVEPIMICYIMPSVLASLATQNLNLEKACRVNLKFGDKICDALIRRETENYTRYEEDVQTLTASVQAWKNVIQSTIPVLLILFVGAWSDKTGKRKACILMPIVGEFLTCIGFIVNTYFFYELPIEAAAFTECIFPALTGGWYTNFIGMFSYVSDITTNENRTYRMGLVSLCMSLGYPLGSSLSGILLQWIGYYGVFSFSSCLYLFSLIYGYYYVEDPKRESKEINEKTKGFFKEFFDLTLVADTFKVAFRQGPNKRRLKVTMIIIGIFVIYGPVHGEYTVMYLFARYRFNWNEVQFSMWSTYSIITNALGTLFSISFFTNYLKLHDSILGIISCSSKIAAAFAYAFARNDLEIYIAPLVELLNSASFTALRAILSKLVSADEFGKVYSLSGLAEASVPIVYGPLYSRIYMETLTVLPGAFYLVGAFLTLPAIAIFGWLFYEHGKDPPMEENVQAVDIEKRHSLISADIILAKANV